MKNLMIVLTLILGVSIFSSCSKEECETCTYTFAWADADYTAADDSDAAALMAEVMEDYTDGELCDDALSDAKAAATDGVVESGEAVVDVECCAAEGEDADPSHAAYHDHSTPAYTVTMTCVASE